MKRNSIQFIIVFILSLFFAVPAMAGVEINADNFPDKAFREVAAGFDEDKDGWLIPDEFTAVKEIDCKDNSEIKDLSGIEIFENLESLGVWNCSSLTKLNLSANTKLTYLDCCDTGISSLDVSSNTNLHQLWAYGNKIAVLDLSSNPWLTKAVNNGIYNNDENNGTACSFADDETSSYLVVDKTVRIKLADRTVDVAELSGYTPGETKPAETPAEDESQEDNSSGDDSSGNEGGSSSGTQISRTFTFLPLKDGDYFLVGESVTIPYSITMTAANGQTYCTITVEDPNGETEQIASSDTVRSGDQLRPSFTPESEGTYKITAVVGSYIDFFLGGPGGIRNRGRFPSITDTISIRVVTTLPTEPSPEEPAAADPTDPPAANPTQTDSKNEPTKSGGETEPTKTADSTQPKSAAAVAKKVATLPAVSKLKATDEAKVTEAYKAYKALSGEEKAKLPEGTYSKIEKARAQIKKIQKAEAADKSSVKNREAKITSRKSDKDLSISTYAPLKVSAVTTAQSSITVKWSKVTGAAGYIVYGNLSGNSYKMKLLTTTTKTKAQVKKIGEKALKKGKYYKFIVVAYKTKNGYKKCVAISNIVHACTTGGSATDVKQVKPKVAKKTLVKGKTWTIKASTVKKAAKKSVKKILGLRFESSNQAVATVSSKGVVTAKKAGKATIYVYAQNGVRATVAVTVKSK